MKQVDVFRFGAALLVTSFIGCSVDTPSLEESAAESTSPPMLDATPNTTGDPEAIRPFEIKVPDAVLDDLRNRLAATRLPDQIGTAWDYGTNREYLSELLDYWQHDFDWRAQEQMLNAFDQFKTNIDGLDVHFIHQRSPHEEALPLVITHGWPGSFMEFH